MWNNPKPIEVRHSATSSNRFIFVIKFVKLEFVHRVEEELRLLTDTTDGDGTTKRKSARRSFFRRKKHQRSSSRDSKDLSTFSSTQLSWFSDFVMGEDGALAGYQRVERLDCEYITLFYDCGLW